MIEKISDFKDRFNQALSIRNMKPIELSIITGISEATISQYRSGYSKPKDERLYVIANALDMNPAWLMGLNVPMEAQPNMSKDKVEKAKALYKEIESLTPEKQAALLNYLKFLQTDSELPHLS
jgi:transcriptional regulator with XRE-family HTH domain